MAFVNERISEEDELRLGFKYRWIIDREREIFLDWQPFGREDFLIKFRLFSYLDGKLLIKADAKDRCHEVSHIFNVKNTKWYDLYNTFIPEAMMPKKEELIVLLVEAIDEYARTTSNKRYDDIKVKITPFRD